MSRQENCELVGGAQIPSDAAVVLDKVCHRFGASQVLRDVSFSIARGERVALLGPSGAGKTTLLRLIAAALPPTEGVVRTLGQDTATLSGRQLRRLRRRVGFLHQSDNLVPQLRVVHNVGLGRVGHWGRIRALWSLVWPQDVDRIRAALDQVELADRLWDYPDTLSGGEQQRVAIARLLVQEPALVLADEPASALDVRLGRDVVTRLTTSSLARRSGLLVSLHTLELLGPHFDRIVALRGGELAWQGEPSQLQRSTLADIYGTEYRGLNLSGSTPTP
ncbi:MAG: ATP-binding cassette domain-containing protein [Nannocystaceae bacterium]